MSMDDESALSVSKIMEESKEVMAEDFPAWNVHAREGDGGLHLCVDMPGLAKEDVRVSVEGTTLVIGGQGNDGVARRYSTRVDLSKEPRNCYKMGQIKAEMSNGALKVFVPFDKLDPIVITVD